MPAADILFKVVFYRDDDGTIDPAWGIAQMNVRHPEMAWRVLWSDGGSGHYDPRHLHVIRTLATPRLPAGIARKAN